MSAKVQKNIDILGNFKVKYTLLVAIWLLLSQILFGFVTAQRVLAANPATAIAATDITLTTQQDSIRDANARRAAQRTRRTQTERRNASSTASADTAQTSAPIDTVNISQRVDTTSRKRGGMGISAPIIGRAKDSLYYDLRSKKVYLYEQGEVS